MRSEAYASLAVETWATSACQLNLCVSNTGIGFSMAPSRSLPPELVSAQRAKQSTAVPDPVAILSQRENLDEIERIGTEDWITLYRFESSTTGSKCYFCCFVPRKCLKKVMSHDLWDLRIGDGLPGFTQSHAAGRTKTTYNRFGSDLVEPLVFIRSYHGLKPDQVELLEEFRHFHNLYHDRPNGRFTYFDERGEEHAIIEISEKYVRAKLHPIKQFMAARQLYLAIFFDHNARIRTETTPDKTTPSNRRLVREGLRYSFGVGDMGGEIISHLIGKKLIAPLSITECGVWPHESRGPRRYAEFIIGVDDRGKEIIHVCNEEALGNYFGKNPDAPHFLTPVWFRRDALRKYYDHPDKYSVEDGYLRCGGLWGLRMDNNLPNHIVVYLGDLGGLAYEEQLYWKSFNIPPAANETSETNFKRSFLAEFTDPASPDLILKQRLVAFQERWEERFGWQLFRYLHDDDAHVIKQLRVPLTDSLSEFEHQTLLLAKLLIDSLNDKQLARELGDTQAGEKSLSKLERFLGKNRYPHQGRDLKVLRSLQALRSTAAAHGKGTRFEQLSREIGLNDKPKSEVFSSLLAQVSRMLSDLEAFFVQTGAA